MTAIALSRAQPRIDDRLDPPIEKRKLNSLAIEYADWLHHLALLDESQRLPMETYEVVGESLQSMELNPTEALGVRNLLVEMTTNTKGILTHRYLLESLQNFLRVILDVYEQCGGEPLILFCQAPDLRNAPLLEEVVRGLLFIKTWYQSSSRLGELNNLLFAFYRDQIGFAELLSTLAIKAPAPQTHISQDPNALRILYQRFAGEFDDPNVVFPLPTEILEKVKEQYDVVQSYCWIWKSLHLGELLNLAKEVSGKDEKLLDDTLKLVAIGCLAIRHEFHIHLHNTQVWAVLAQLNHLGGSIAQIITGEGKSKVATLLAFVLAMKNPSQGHVISSNRSLSVRDQEEHANFFKAFGIDTAHICEDDRDASFFQARILYGTATDFQFALMRQMLYFEKRFSSKAFDWVIVDEVDNLTIDTSLNGARLSYSAEITYDWVYVPIFSFVQSHFPIEYVPDAMLDQLRVYLKDYREGFFSHYVDCFSDRKLKGWIQAACQALQYKEKENYIIGLKDSTRGEKIKAIFIVDAENTGRILYGSRWTGGLHEFVEIKHGLEIARENLCPISMSHPVFYPMYKSLFGITGTIGSKYEREELKAIYQIDSFDVPTYHPSQRKDAPAAVLTTDAQCQEYYMQAIRRCIEAGRPILVLCPSIKETEILGDLLQQERISFSLLNELQTETEQSVVQRAGLPGAVTIATNTAGRGTDIRPSKESLRNRGLHVLITFYPESDRVELQARGRAGRQGEPGSSEVVISGEHLSMDPSEALSYLKDLRQQRAIHQKDAHIASAEIERHAFEMVQEFYQMVNTFHELANEDSFLNTMTSFLENRKFLRREERDFSHLSLKNRKLAEATLQLLNSPQDTAMHWRVVIQQLTQRVKDFVIHDFALNFYPLISESLQDSDLILDLNVANWFKELSEQKHSALDVSNHIEAVFRTSSAIKLGIIQRELQAAFSEEKRRWQDYLDPSGRGILKYLKDQLGLDLVMRKSQRKY